MSLLLCLYDEVDHKNNRVFDVSIFIDFQIPNKFCQNRGQGSSEVNSGCLALIFALLTLTLCEGDCRLWRHHVQQPQKAILHCQSCDKSGVKCDIIMIYLQLVANYVTYHSTPSMINMRPHATLAYKMADLVAGALWAGVVRDTVTSSDIK